MSRPKISTNVNLTVALPPEFFSLVAIIDEMAIKKGVTRSTVARELLCKALDYSPQIKRKMYEYKTVPIRVRKNHPSQKTGD